MSYTKNFIHAVWATRDRKPILESGLRQEVIGHICEYARIKNVHIIEINGQKDHLHCIIQLSADQNIATVMNLIKGESSFWINKNGLTDHKFGWEEEYFAVSVGQSQLDKVSDYIRNQEIHHRNKTFLQEFDEFIQIYFTAEKG